MIVACGINVVYSAKIRYQNEQFNSNKRVCSQTSLYPGMVFNRTMGSPAGQFNYQVKVVKSTLNGVVLATRVKTSTGVVTTSTSRFLRSWDTIYIAIPNSLGRYYSSNAPQLIVGTYGSKHVNVATACSYIWG